MKLVLVTGARVLPDADKPIVSQALHRHQPDIIMHGGAEGVDAYAGERCRANKRREWCVPADWKRYGKGAGPIRNGVMVEVAAMLAASGHDVVVLAFPGPESIGTHDCVRQAGKAKLTVETHNIGERQ